jgi:hypothetical protein
MNGLPSGAVTELNVSMESEMNELKESTDSGKHRPVTLTSWRNIAKYFGKDVRTVQRWERKLGLPVRRPQGALGNSPKAPVLADTRIGLYGRMPSPLVRNVFSTSLVDICRRLSCKMTTHQMLGARVPKY